MTGQLCRENTNCKGSSGQTGEVKRGDGESLGVGP